MQNFTIKITSLDNGELSTKILLFSDMDTAFDCLRSVAFASNVRSVYIDGLFENPYMNDDGEEEDCVACNLCKEQTKDEYGDSFEDIAERLAKSVDGYMKAREELEKSIPTPEDIADTFFNMFK